MSHHTERRRERRPCSCSSCVARDGEVVIAYIEEVAPGGDRLKNGEVPRDPKPLHRGEDAPCAKR